MKCGLLILLFVLSVSCLRNKHKDEGMKPFCGTVNPIEDSQKKSSGDESIGSFFFKAKCTSCHLLEQNGTGPALGGVLNRVPDEQWLKCYLMNHDSLLKSGDTVLLRILNQSPASCLIPEGMTEEMARNLIKYLKE